MRSVRGFCLFGLLAEGALLAALSASAGLSALAWVIGLASVSVPVGLFARALARRRARAPRPADWITLVRAVLTAGVAAVMVAASRGDVAVDALVAMSSVALVLDGFDGYVARRTGTASELGARFDLEVDAFLILILSVQVSRTFGTWVLLIGLARYGLLGAERLVRWLRRPVPSRYWRKVVAALQGIVLTVAASALLPYGVTAGLIAVALLLLVESFGRDVRWLARRRTAAAGGTAGAPPEVARAEPVRPREMVTHG